MTAKINRVMKLAVLFFYIFGVRYKHIPVSTSKLAAAFLLCLELADILAGRSAPFKIRREYKIPFLLLIILLVSSVLTPLIMNSHDFSVVYNIFLLIFEDFLGGILVYRFLCRGEGNDISLYEQFCYFIDICFLQSFIIIMMLFSDRIRTFIWSISANEAVYLRLYRDYQGIRGFGMASSATYDLSMLISFALIFLAYKISKDNYKHMSVDIVKYAVIFGAVCVTGRTGFIGFGFSCIIFVIDLCKRPVRKHIIKIFAAVCAAAAAFGLILNFVLNPDMKEKIISFAFELFVNIKTSGKIGVYSLDYVQDMYFKLPLETFLFGDGYYQDAENGWAYMFVDAGYMRQVLFFGIGSCILLCYLFYTLFRKSLQLSKNRDRLLFYVLIFMLIYLYAGNYKGDVLLGCRMITKTAFLIFTVSVAEGTGFDEKTKSISYYVSV